jgi:hypothetical protein
MVENGIIFFGVLTTVEKYGSLVHNLVPEAFK